ncbi:MAG TPA: hypothetical protein VFI65_27100 [Streptosporangiaceae bacterium]|nr:hypothetical protein [Streptosporangiaceae bacterium]
MNGKTRAILTVAATIVLPAATLVLPSVTNASAALTPVHECETNGGQFCIGAPTLAADAPVVETASGRTLYDWFNNPSGGGYISGSGNGSQFSLQAFQQPSFLQRFTTR